jgi:Abnormal spindle-like microcephaly-assoc'd, ASPM-SPD-2-Hydin/PQQ-like domain
MYARVACFQLAVSASANLQKLLKALHMTTHRALKLKKLSIVGKAFLALSALPALNCLAAATVSPTSLNWVFVAVGNTGGQKVVTLTNGNASAITISSVTLSGANPGDFKISSKTCGSSLAASASCTANIAFAPTTTGNRSATLNFNDSDGSSPQTVALTGLGTSSSGTVSISPTSLTFSSTTVGSTSATQSATLTNGSSSSITISSVSISGTNATDFVISSKTCGTSLAASASCTASIAFEPSATGTRTATLTFTDSASNSPQTVALTGTGVAASGSASVSPTSLSWVYVAVGNRGGAKAATLTNSGTSSLTINGIALSGANPGDYQITSKTCGFALAASASCTASVAFAPVTSGTRTATLTFNDSASNTPQTVTLSGLGTIANSVSASPSSLSYPSTPVGTSSASQSAQLTNGLSSTVTISSVAISGTNAADFTVSSKTCGTSLGANSACSATIVFKPTAAGTRTANLSFTDSATNSPQTVSLSGVGGSGFTISPLSPSVSVNGTVQFSASSGATWAASCGSITSGGLYTAPASSGSCTVTGTATDGSGHTAATTVTVTSNTGSVTVTPSPAHVHAIGQAQFTSNKSVTWSTSCGSISSAGLFTAPAVAGNCTIKAVSTTDSSDSGTATASVTVVNYVARKNGSSGTGVQADELVLTPANVSSGKFAQLWSKSLDGSIWGQPLFMNAVNIGGKVRNAIFAVTNNDSVYAFDADTGSQLWKTTFLSTGVTAVAGTSVSVSSQTGILSTPVIDPVKQIMYVVAETSENNATTFPHRLHALSVITGKDISVSPVLISDPALQPVMKFQRPGLLLANGNVYVGFGSIEDRSPYHGLLFSFDATTLEKNAVFNLTPTGNEAGLWMSGASPATDSDGNIYISTGNGTVSTNNYGESIVKLSPSLQELDFFTASNWSYLNQNDLDLGSGSVIVVPDQNGPYPHELIACGKPTPIYVFNRDSLGDLGATSDHIVQELDNQIGNKGNFRDSGQPCYNSPAMWQQNVYFAPNHDVLKMFVLDPNTGMLSSTPVSKGTYTYLWPGSDPVVSSNGSTNGIVWTLDSSTATLIASDATDVSKTLYNSASLGFAVRWVPPTVANGHVYVALSSKLASFGLTP